MELRIVHVDMAAVALDDDLLCAMDVNNAKGLSNLLYGVEWTTSDKHLDILT